MRPGESRSHSARGLGPFLRAGGIGSAMVAAVLCSAPPAATGADEQSPATAATSGDLTLTATELDAVGLTYVGTVTVPGPSGELRVLRLALNSGALTTMRLSHDCAAGITTVTTAGSVTVGDATFDAVSLSATVAGMPLVFTVANPPTTPFPAEVLLHDLTLDATTVSANTLSTTALATHAAGC